MQKLRKFQSKNEYKGFQWFVIWSATTANIAHCQCLTAEVARITYKVRLRYIQDGLLGFKSAFCLHCILLILKKKLVLTSNDRRSGLGDTSPFRIMVSVLGTKDKNSSQNFFSASIIGGLLASTTFIWKDFPLTPSNFWASKFQMIFLVRWPDEWHFWLRTTPVMLACLVRPTCAVAGVWFPFPILWDFYSSSVFYIEFVKYLDRS